VASDARVVTSFAAVLALIACGCGGPSSAGVRAAPTVRVPAIWSQPSSSINPRALPLRDRHYVTNGPKKGYMYICDARAFQQLNGPGAQREGPWLDNAAGTYDVTEKPVVQGRVYYPDAVFTITTTKTRRLIRGDGLPLGVPTGTFPVRATDPAGRYDPNPNRITSQKISFSIPRHPQFARSPLCSYKQVGITLDGVQLHGPLDSIGRDELAYQLQDVCTGGPQPGGGYHRHALSECTPHIHERNALVGYALDGFGIFSPYDKNGKELTTANLDACHGTTSKIPWEGKMVMMYHYVITRDFPYTVACFRGTPTRNAFPALPGAPPQH
jgi:hypothetical protein